MCSVRRVPTTLSALLGGALVLLGAAPAVAAGEALLTLSPTHGDARTPIAATFSYPEGDVGCDTQLVAYNWDGRLLGAARPVRDDSGAERRCVATLTFTPPAGAPPGRHAVAAYVTTALIGARAPYTIDSSPAPRPVPTQTMPAPAPPPTPDPTGEPLPPAVAFTTNPPAAPDAPSLSEEPTATPTPTDPVADPSSPTAVAGPVDLGHEPLPRWSVQLLILGGGLVLIGAVIAGSMLLLRRSDPVDRA
jgi:hypothetical protein